MTLQEIKEAVESGKTVHWGNMSYNVITDNIGQWFIVHYYNCYCIGLTSQDGTLNGKEEEFFICEH